MHPHEIKAEALALVEARLNDCEISRRLGIPRRTILDWRRPPEQRYARRVITDAPWRLLRGLIRSDGCAFINRTGPYEYLSYDFTNRSTDIVDLFARTCEVVGIEYRLTRFRVAGRSESIAGKACFGCSSTWASSRDR